MFYGAEWFVFLLGYVLFLGVAVLVGYLVIKAAVRNGTLEAHRRLDKERGSTP